MPGTRLLACPCGICCNVGRAHMRYSDPFDNLPLPRNTRTSLYSLVLMMSRDVLWEIDSSGSRYLPINYPQQF